MDSASILQFFFTGVTNGAIYAFIALGLHLAFTASKIFNFLQGGLLLWGSLFLYFVLLMGTPLWMSIIIAMAGGVALSIAFYFLCVETLKERIVLMPILALVFAALMLDNISYIVLPQGCVNVSPFVGGLSIKIFGAGISSQSPLVLVAIGLSLVLLLSFFRKTIWGRILVANSDTPEAIRFIGVNPSRISTVSFILCGLFGAVAGILVSPITGIRSGVGLAYSLKGFASAMLGGITSTVGVVVGGFLIGLLEAFFSGFVSSGLSEAFVYLIIIIVLVLRPSGLLGRE